MAAGLRQSQEPLAWPGWEWWGGPDQPNTASPTPEALRTQRTTGRGLQETLQSGCPRDSSFPHSHSEKVRRDGGLYPNSPFYLIWCNLGTVTSTQINTGCGDSTYSPHTSSWSLGGVWAMSRVQSVRIQGPHLAQVVHSLCTVGHSRGLEGLPCDTVNSPKATTRLGSSMPVGSNTTHLGAQRVGYKAASELGADVLGVPKLGAGRVGEDTVGRKQSLPQGLCGTPKSDQARHLHEDGGWGPPSCGTWGGPWFFPT